MILHLNDLPMKLEGNIIDNMAPLIIDFHSTLISNNNLLIVFCGSDDSPFNLLLYFGECLALVEILILVTGK